MQNYYFSMKLKHMFLFFNDLKMKRMVIHPIYSVAIINAPIVITNMKRMNDIVFLDVILLMTYGWKQRSGSMSVII
jgi:hypothetical protein